MCLLNVKCENMCVCDPVVRLIKATNQLLICSQNSVYHEREETKYVETEREREGGVERRGRGVGRGMEGARD